MLITFTIVLTLFMLATLRSLITLTSRVRTIERKLGADATVPQHLRNKPASNTMRASHTAGML